MKSWSRFGKRFTRITGARELMDDLGSALGSDHPVAMLGGGNPAHIPAMEDVFIAEMTRVLSDRREYRRMFANYPSPGGEERFRENLASLLAREYGWSLGARNIALTNGSQAGFFLLFNLLAGPDASGIQRRILLPVTPEYIGYQDVGLAEGLLTARQPDIEYLGERMFKYRLNMQGLNVGPDVAALCVSRPTNPTGNVLTDAEMNDLAGIAAAADVPLIVDNAYGMPFPRILFTEVQPVWNDNMILCMSLSKLGLPGIRTGIVVAHEDVVEAIGSMNSVLSLAVPSVGAVLVNELVASGRILELCETVIRPFYRRKVEQALDWVREYFDGLNYYVHKPEGALFLWLWFPELPISSHELYRRLKARDVLVLSGHHFFPGLQDDWAHRHECIRLTYSQDSESVRQGIAALADEVRRVSG